MTEGTTRVEAERKGLGAKHFIKSPLTRFILAAIAWLPVTFGSWYLLGPVLLWPVRLLVQLICKIGLSDLVRGVEVGGSS
ncbi:MAG TPA: exosortase H-associated membrane protein, partial [Casimicrobiaceae bacterium]